MLPDLLLTPRERIARVTRLIDLNLKKDKFIRLSESLQNSKKSERKNADNNSSPHAHLTIVNDRSSSKLTASFRSSYANTLRRSKMRETLLKEQLQSEVGIGRVFKRGSLIL
jgi:hypothetical protein